MHKCLGRWQREQRRQREEKWCRGTRVKGVGHVFWPLSLWNRVNFKAPVTYTREQLPMGVYIPWEETYALYTPYSILREDTAKRLGQVTSSLCLSCFVRTTGQ